jgi:predicted lipoprotein with Yx(FWY)xxD motif
MRFTLRRAGGPSWTARAALAALLVSGSIAATVGVAAGVQAQIRPVGSGSSATVVKVATRSGFGKILVTVNGGHSLYEHPNGSCGPSCRSIWPPLLMPAGTTTPKGASCLATAKLGTKLQVTYHGQRLYTFTGDSGQSVNGNGVAGFKVAKVTTKCP